MSIREIDGHKLSLYPREVSRVLDGDKNNSLLQVEIGVTDNCNHRCNYCSLDWIKRGGNYIDKNKMLYALEDMKELGVGAVYFAGEGEPLLHKDFPEFVKKVSDLEMGVSVSTNGNLLTEETARKILPYLNWIRIGIDASTPETYSHIHGTRKENFRKTIDNLTTISRIKKENNYLVDIGVQSLLLPENANEIKDLTRLIKNTRVDNLQIKPFSQHPFAKRRDNLVDYKSQSLKDLKKEIEKLSNDSFNVVYRDKSMERTTQVGEYRKCLGLDFWTLVDAKGNVVPCNMFYDKPEFSFGNINDKSFKEIWNGKRRQYVLNKISRNKCKNYTCRPDLLNRYMWRIKNPEPNDSFI